MSRSTPTTAPESTAAADVARLAARLESLLAQLEPLVAHAVRLLPPPQEPDWDRAIAFRWRRRRSGLGSVASLVPVGRPAALRLDDLDVDRVELFLDDVHVATDGGRHPSYREEDGQRVMKQAEIVVRVVLARGSAATTVWTCDLSHDYVSINADYRS